MERKKPSHQMVKSIKMINGTQDWVYEEEFAYTKAYDWSPDSEYMPYMKFNESKVRILQ